MTAMNRREMPSLSRRDDLCRHDILCSILGLRGLQSEVYWTLSGRDMETPEIARRVGRDRTSVQRAVQDLIALGLATRRPLPTRRGRKYSYSGICSDKLRERLRRELDAYYDRVYKEIATIGRKA